MSPSLVKQLLVAMLALSAAQPGQSELNQDAKSSTTSHNTTNSSKKHSTNLDSKRIEIKSLNTQRVGLIDEDVSATIIYTKNGAYSKGNRFVLVKFSVNVVVNAYSKKGCRSSSCLIEVRFDNGKTTTYKVYESDKDYLTTVLIKDYSFFENLSRTKTTSIKMRFADITDGTFIFKNLP